MMTDPALWARIAASPIGPESGQLTFTAKLARENGWSAGFAARVIGEYRRFAYLAIRAGHPVTPSDAVDQAWHLHLTYSRDYWERFCPEVLGGPLHHEPTAGGAGERARHHAQYAATLAAYEREFGPPPDDVWPSAARLLDEDWRARRVHPRDALIVPRRIAASLGAVLLLGAGALIWGGWPG